MCWAEKQKEEEKKRNKKEEKNTKDCSNNEELTLSIACCSSLTSIEEKKKMRIHVRHQAFVTRFLLHITVLIVVFFFFLLINKTISGLHLSLSLSQGKLFLDSSFFRSFPFLTRSNNNSSITDVRPTRLLEPFTLIFFFYYQVCQYFFFLIKNSSINCSDVSTTISGFGATTCLFEWHGT